MPPIKKSRKYWLRWFLLAPSGFILIGLGLSVTIEAAIWRFRGEELWRWIILGTIGLVIFNAGIAVVGGAIKNRVFYEYRVKKEKRRSKNGYSSDETDDD